MVVPLAREDPPPHAALAELVQCLGTGARVNESMASHTSLRVGGPADVFFTARTTARLVEAVDLAVALGVPWRVVGAASNLLIADDGVDGLVVKAATQSRSWSLSSDTNEAVLVAEAGCILASLARQLVRDGLEGMEWAVNVPGTVGAAIVNNAGAFGSSIVEHLVEAVLHCPGQGPRTMTSDQLGMSYRTSVLKRGELQAVVIRGSFRVRPAARVSLEQRTRETQRARQATQPTGPSLGSMFANPPGDAAGRLIDAAGFKGTMRGTAEISRLHANFMLNRGGARACDVLDLMQKVQHIVWERSGHWLAPEVQLAGRWRDEDLLALQSPPGKIANPTSSGHTAESIRPAGVFSP
jgi:UDP-N-acetylmuramate dehydrogenase